MKHALLVVVSILAPVSLVLAQNEPPPGGGGLADVDWLRYAALILNTVLVPLLADVLKPVWTKAPMWLKSIMPLFVGSALGMLESWLLGVLGFPVDLGLIVAVFTGGGAAASLAFKQGKAQGIAGG